MFFPLLLLLVWFSLSSASPQSHLFRNSYLSVEDGASLLISEDKSFSSGFYKVGLNAYTFSIWFTDSADKTVVWTANRDKPVNGHGSRLTLLNNGAMVLTDVDGTVAWSTAATSSVPDRARLRDSGNLVVEDSNGRILWQSFDSPTDTLLPSQPITKNSKLVSAIARGSFSSGYFGFYFDDSNVLRLKYDGPEVSSVYWPNPDQTVWQNGRTIYNSSRYAVLDDKGRFLASDRFQFGAADEGKPWIKRKLTLDYDGNLRLYSLENRTRGLWSVTWQALLDTCQVHGLCGKNGICSSHDGLACLCPPGFEMTDPSNWNLGCRTNFSLSCPLKEEEMEFTYLQHTDFWGFDIRVATGVSLDDCKRICMADCSCQGFSYRVGSGLCYPKSVLYNGRTSPYSHIYIKSSRPTATLIKLQHQLLICNATGVAPTVGSSQMMMKKKSSSNTIWIFLYSLLAVIFVVEGLFISVGWWFIYSKEDDHVLMAEGYKAISNQFRRFSYRELEKATRNFKEELGRGGSGVVYKGVLENGMVAAVKKLEDVRQGGEEFWGEVSVIGRIYHMNLVRTWGFCSEDLHRLLVCEFVENGSLEKALFDPNKLLLGWKERFQIAVGVARGLAYLHHECLEWVIHCDVKPENILLDRNYEPKIADFGLAKLLNRGVVGSNLSRIRGTRGYIAPEWASNLPITGKIDVYSYGVVLLELVSGSRVSDLVMKGVTEMMAMKTMCAKLGRNLERGGVNWVGSFVDMRLKGEFDSNQAVRMVKVAVSCLGEEGSRRPTMETVVQMLHSGDEELYSDATESLQFSSFSTDT